MDFIEEKMDVNLRGKVILINRCQVMEEHIRRLETELIEVKGHDTVETIRNMLDPLYKAAEIPRWEKVSVGKGPIQNPLLIEEIVQCIVKNLDYKTQRSLRQVHSCWDNAIMTPGFLNKTVLRIGISQDIEGLFEAFPVSNTSFADFPRAVEMYNLDTTHSRQMLVNWFGVYGEMITSIVIHRHDQKDQMFQDLLTGLLPNLLDLRLPDAFSTQIVFKYKQPTLHKLESLEFGSACNGSAWSLHSTNLKSILKSTLNLKSLKLNVTQSGPPLYTQPIDYLRTCHESGYISQLVTLDLFGFRLTLEGLQLLSQVPLSSLKRLVFPKYDLVDGNLLIEQIFENVQNTLEYLRVDAVHLGFIPQMNELRDLKCDWSYFRGHSINSNDFMLRLPQLENIVIDNYAFFVTDQILQRIFTPHHQNNSVKSLEIINVIVGQHRLHTIVSSMQNLKTLKIKVPLNGISTLKHCLSSSMNYLKERGIQMYFNNSIVNNLQDF